MVRAGKHVEMRLFSGENVESGRSVPGLLRRTLHWDLWLRIFDNVDRKHLWPMAAALSFYFLLSLFPALILLSAVVAFLPGHALFDQAVNRLTLVLPRDSMQTVRGVLADAITPNRGTYLSLGFIGTILTLSNSMSTSIEALNMAYGVNEDRPWWKTRLLSIALALLIGLLLVTALSVMIVGPRFAEWLASKMDLSALFVMLWPIIHWIVAVGFTVVGIETLYLFGPTGRRRLRTTLPGAALAVASWLVMSYFLGVYFRHFSSLDRNYGALGGAIALMIWLYWIGFAILVGAELNAQLAALNTEQPHSRRRSQRISDRK